MRPYSTRVVAELRIHEENMENPALITPPRILKLPCLRLLLSRGPVAYVRIVDSIPNRAC